jgi:CDP-diacylglycerol--serine O-phosphatidyltransferase
MKIFKAIPSFITSLNLACGAAAAIFALQGEIKIAVLLILAAAIFDFFDGFAARLLKAVSEFGKQLDSLADLVSFGFAPAAILYYHIESNAIFPKYFAFSVILIVVFSALRLAKFNIDTEQKTEFRGLPTPASALFIVSLLYPSESNIINLTALITNPYIVASIVILLPTLMVSRIKLFSLKVKSLSFKENIWQIILAISAISLLIIFGISGLAFTIILYLALSILKQSFHKAKIE